MEEKKRRIILLDELRGFAIIAMIVHHTFYDIGDVLYIDWGTKIFNDLCAVQPIFWALFIVISGICSRLSRNTIKRGAIVLGAGLVITFVTTIIMPKMNMPNEQIYFGILSCLGSCMIITGLLMPLIKKINPVVGTTVSAVLFAVTYSISNGSLLFGLIPLPQILYKTNYLMPLGFFNSSFSSADYFALFPWLFMFLIGAFIGKFAKDGAFPDWSYKSHFKPFAFVGKNSLWFYLAHQPVLFGIMYIIQEIIVKIALM